MQVVVCCGTKQKEELLSSGLQHDAPVFFVEDISHIDQFAGDSGVVLDLLFVNDEKRIHMLKQSGHTVIINSVVDAVEEVDPYFVRINAWPTFLQSPIIEAACLHRDVKEKAERALQLFNRKAEWLPDEPGFITPRVVSMIVNEAYFALSEGVSSKDETDTAMKLGTAYPYGPFEWGERIGLDKIADLLSRLSNTEPRYAPSQLLLKEAGRTKN